MNPRQYLRLVLRRTPAALPVLLALGGFWVLSPDLAGGRGAFTGYAEEQLHPVAPLQVGRLKSVPVQLGMPVHAGDVVAVLDARPLELQRAELLTELAQAEAQLVAAQDVQRAGLQRGQLQAVRTHAIEERSRAELRELNVQVKRLRQLSAAHLVRQSELEAALVKQQAVEADLRSRPTGTPRELQLMGLQPRPQSDQLERLEDRLAPYRAALQVKQAALHQVEYAIGEMTLRAPVDGMIDTILLWPGAMVTPATPVLNIVAMRPGRIVAFVPERQVHGVRVGGRVKVRRIGRLLGALPGRLTALAPIVEEVPPRARVSPTAPLWARRVLIELDTPVQLLPGEAFHVGLR